MHPLETAVTTYLKEIRDQRKLTNTTDELSYRDYLGKLLRETAKVLNRNADFTGEAKKLVVGKPDYEVTRGAAIIGYIEAESINYNLAALKGHAKEQNQRFRDNLHNFLLTNHLEWRLFCDGEQVVVMKLPEPPESGTVSVSVGVLEEFQSLLERFLDTATPVAMTPEQIARQLASRARELRHTADFLLLYAESPLATIWNAYRETLFADINKDEFANVYAQTLVYGLFLAWHKYDRTDSNPFTRQAALDTLPASVPIIQKLLRHSANYDLPEELVWIVNGVCSDLDVANKDSILKPFKDGRDPIFHFYETFLAAYDKTQRERRGVYYTPDSVVEFIVRATDDLLKDPVTFDKQEGLADKTVKLLDPATGTGTFLAHAYKHVYDGMTLSGGRGIWSDRARTHLLQNFYGIELLPSAYTIAHIKLSVFLTERDVKLQPKDRIPVYLANSLETIRTEERNLPLVLELSQEKNAAVGITQTQNILVVMGNPPYSGHSANPSKNKDGSLTSIGKLVQDYYFVDGKPLGEKNPKWLQDDYVKFLRFAQDIVDRNGQGIVGFVTNHGYLDNPTFRGMRRSLMQSFDALYLLDLHGNSKKKERAPDGSKDENVFDIQQGVAICLLIKHPNLAAQGKTLKHGDLWGLREAKYEALNSMGLEDVVWTDITPTAPHYLLKPEDNTLLEEYNAGWSVPDIFPTHSTGITTARDNLSIHWTAKEIFDVVKDFASLSEAEARIKYKLTEDARDWKVPLAQKDLKESGLKYDNIVPVIYKPFDIRYTYYTGVSRGFHCMPRGEVISHLHVEKFKNLCLVFSRGATAGQLYEHIFCTRYAMLVRAFPDAACVAYLAPLYRYDANGTLYGHKHANIAPAFLKALQERIGSDPAPEAIFHYAYAVFHAPTYRQRYAAFLKIDFPRLPLPHDLTAFEMLAALGAKLVALHLLEAPSLNRPGISFPVGGDHRVQKLRATDRYLPPSALALEGDNLSGRVKLNATEYFENVPLEAWEFRVGGYQPAYKWLDDRADRFLTDDEIIHYMRMLAAMRETAALLPEVDAAFTSPPSPLS